MKKRRKPRFCSSCKGTCDDRAYYWPSVGVLCWKCSVRRDKTRKCTDCGQQAKPSPRGLLCKDCITKRNTKNAKARLRRQQIAAETVAYYRWETVQDDRIGLPPKGKRVPLIDLGRLRSSIEVKFPTGFKYSSADLRTPILYMDALEGDEIARAPRRKTVRKPREEEAVKAAPVYQPGVRRVIR